VRSDRERWLIERMSLIFEQAGMAPAGGRILSRLLICDPPEQSSAELAEWLGVSKGSVSTQTQMLVRSGFIDRVRRSGSRAHWYRIRPGLFSDLLQLEVVRTQQLHDLCVEAIAFKAEAGEPLDERLHGFQAFTEFFLDRLPALIDEWRELQVAYHPAPPAHPSAPSTPTTRSED